MYEAKPLGPKLRAFFVVAFSFGVLLLIWGGYVEKSQHPAPRWAEHLPTAFLAALWVLLILLSPMPGMTRNMAKAFLAFWVVVCAIELFLLFF